MAEVGVVNGGQAVNYERGSVDSGASWAEPQPRAKEQNLSGRGMLWWVLSIRENDSIPSCLENFLWEPDSPKDRGDVAEHQLTGGHWQWGVGETDRYAYNGEGLITFWWPVQAEPSSV
jgi:hypothetical protein